MSQSNYGFVNLYLKWVNQLCTLFAVVGGLMLMATAAITISSIIGREFLSVSIPSFDITKAAMGIIIAASIPFCILNGGNLIVDFFTTKTSAKTQRNLDVLGAVLTGIGVGLFAWRTTAAIADVRSSNEVIGNTDIAVWWIYLAMSPALWLAVAAAFALAINTWRGQLIDSEAQAILKQAQTQTQTQAQIQTQTKTEGQS